MAYIVPIDSIWAHAAHPSTRNRSRTPSPEPPSTTAANGAARLNNTISTHQQATLQRRLLRQATRGDHLPGRSVSAEQARLLRTLKGYPPLGSSAEADQLSDLEESILVGKHQTIRFGERYIVQIGRRRTMHEEELSNEEDEGRRGGLSEVEAGTSGLANGLTAVNGEDGEMVSDEEGPPGPFIGGHTGHAQADLVTRQTIETERRVREAEATRAAAAAVAARSQAERRAAIQEEQDAVDLDADIEDLDEGEEDVDFD